MGEEFKNQHIVCQAYLNRFAKKMGKRYIIGTRLKSTNQGVKLFTNSVANVAYIENYYDTCAQSDKKFWEHYLDKQFDVLCGQPLDNIIAKITLCPSDRRVLTESDKELLARIIISQTVRVPAFLDANIERTEDQLKEYKQEFLASLPSVSEKQRSLIEQISFDFDERKNIVLSCVFDEDRFNRFCSVLTQKVWCVFYNGIRDVMPFITSDNPVVITDMKGREETMTSIGLANDRTVILYPLTPSILIGIYSADVFFGELPKYDGHRMTIDDVKFITNVNLMLMRQSYIHSFLPEPLFSMAKQGV